MKKFLAILLALAMILTFTVGCGKTEEPAPAAAPAAEPAAEPAATEEVMGTTDIDLKAAADFVNNGWYGDADDLNGEGEIHLTAGTSTALTSLYVQGLMVMADLLEDYSNGQLTIDIHTDSSLGGERDMIESVSMASQDVLVTSTGPIGNFVPDFLSLDLPYLFQNEAEAYKVLDGEVGQALLDQFTAQGVYAVNFWENGYRNTSNAKREIVHPEDLNGLKLRTMENQIHMATYSNWGVYATPMAMGEVYPACQQGTIDGQENPLAIINSNKLQEVQPYISMTKVFYSPSVLMISLDVYNGLTDFQKACWDKAAKEAQEFERALSAGTLASDRAEIEQTSKVTDVDIAEFAGSEAVAKVYTDAVSLGANQSVIDAANKVLGR